MRIIAGTLKGRHFETPHGHKTHPMGDRVKGGLFNVLGDLSDMTVFDCYGGSGALAFEAVSRGAARVLITENDNHATRIIKRNIEALGINGAVRLVAMSCTTWSDQHEGERFDVVIADPPYDAVNASAVAKLSTHTSQAGVFVVSWPGSQDPPELLGFQREKSKSYGDAALHFYMRVTE